MESKTQFCCLIRNLSMLMTFLLIGLSDFTFITSVGAVDPKSYLQDTIEELKKKWPHNRSIRIVCHGHSVPAGYFKTPHVDTFNAYPHLLQVGLKERFPHSVINVIVTAIGGENAVQGAERFETEVLTHRPDILLIDYALNDRGIGLEKARDAWVSMIRKALSQETKVILLTPTGDHRADMNNVDDPLNQHADQIRKLAIEHKVALVDSLSLFKKYTDAGNPLSDLMSQVNHPNRRGHELVADALLDWFPTEE
ncbi:SGNH/GDSL hydrolase family protein [bacterium]|nr:SGNH/GDSL hydrolase family protein [bacterium]